MLLVASHGEFRNVLYVLGGIDKANASITDSRNRSDETRSSLNANMANAVNRCGTSKLWCSRLASVNLSALLYFSTSNTELHTWVHFHIIFNFEYTCSLLLLVVFMYSIYYKINKK